MFEILIYIFKGIFQLLMWTWWIIVPIIAALAFQNLRKAKWAESVESVVLGIKIPKNSEKGPTSAEMMFASLHGILKPSKDLKKEGSIQEHISFEMVADAKSIMFYVWTPKHLQDFVEGQIYAQYPTAEISTVEDYSKNIDIDHDGVDDCAAGCELKLVKPDYFPIKTFVSFEVDPLAGITGALSKIENQTEKMWIQILVRPVSDSWRNKGLQYAENLKNGAGPKIFTKAGILHGLLSLPGFVLNTIINGIFPPEDSKSSGGGDTKLPHNVEASLACLEEKANKLGYQVKIRILYIAESREAAKQHLRITTGAFKQFNTTIANGFTPTKIRTGRNVLNEYRARLFADKGFVLNIEEVASLYHLPHASVETPNIVWTSSKKGEPPANLPYEGLAKEDDLTIFAETTFRGQPKRFGIKRDDRRRHMYIIGKSGTGKSKLLELLAVSDIKKGEGVGVVDPHGELIHDVLKNIPSERINDIIYFNPADKDFPIGFNPLETTPDLREETTSGFVVALERLFGYSWGPRLEYVLRYTVLALTYTEDATMLSIIRMLTDKDYRKKVLKHVEDPVVKTFWLKEWSTYNDRFQAEAVAPILNKVGQFTASPLIRNIVGQARGTFDFASAINSQKILLVDLSTGKIGEDNAELLGSFIITRLQLAAMSRSKIKPEDRRDFYLYVDEFQNFATKSFATILSEARKYKLNLTLANQYIAQVEETVRDAVFGNVGSLISFRVGATDAAYLEKEFSPVFEKNDLINLDNRHMYLNMLIDGVTTVPFSARTIDVMLPDLAKDNTEKIIQVSREKYSISKQEIEDKITRWTGMDKMDVDQRVDKQSTSKFELTNEQLERGETPKKIDEKNKLARFGQTTPKEGLKNLDANSRSAYPKSTDAVKVKKSVDPEELKKIIKKLTQPAQNISASEGPKTDINTPQKTEIRKEVLRNPLVNKGSAPVNLPENVQGEDKEKLQDIKGNTIGKKTEIKITKITGGAEVERVKKQEPLSEPIQPTAKQVSSELPKAAPFAAPRQRMPLNVQGQRPIFPARNAAASKDVSRPSVSRFGPMPVMPKKFMGAEEENVRRLTREEFLQLKEILPNEKIVIVDKKEGESAVR